MAMTPHDFALTLQMLNLSQVACARFVGFNPRQVRRWIAGETRVPRTVELLLLLMLDRELTVPDVLSSAAGWQLAEARRSEP